MNKFHHEDNINLLRVKQLFTVVKKLKKFGAYIEVNEVSRDRYFVELFCPKIHTDILGNSAIIGNRTLRNTPDE